MMSNQGGQTRSGSWAGPMALLAAAAAAGLGLWQTLGGHATLPLAVGLLVLAAALGVFWLYRVRAARRFVAALDAYAERELARAERRPHAPPPTGDRALVKPTEGDRRSGVVRRGTSGARRGGSPSTVEKRGVAGAAKG